jgi:WhiB family redox-sensing transcriptional regulator
VADFDLRRFMRRAEWTADANCRGVDPEIFMFTDDTRLPAGARKLEAALKFCHACDVQAECLAYALNNNEIGVWGGKTEFQRRRIRRQHRKDEAS